ncbi:hypothetical protein [Aureimonas sp. AU22]|uniref:hypothetical protein n=1 Tax=Aureimonas sp. AU22 TaxID=1638162 RepID=UPI000785E53A|nr:hypothetical protein [Aureimonas sp. AU22]
MPEKDILYNVAFFLGSIIAVVIAYFRNSPKDKKPDEQVSSVVAGVGVGFVSKEAEERRDALETRQTVALESIAGSLAVLADRERHEMHEAMEDGFARINQAMKDLGKVTG